MKVLGRVVHRLNSSVAQAAMDADALRLPPLRTGADTVLDVLSTALLALSAVCALLYLLRVYFDNGGVIPLNRRCVPSRPCALALGRPGPALPGPPRGFCFGGSRPPGPQAAEPGQTPDPPGNRYYARRWVSPSGSSGARVQKWLQVRLGPGAGGNNTRGGVAQRPRRPAAWLPPSLTAPSNASRLVLPCSAQAVCTASVGELLPHPALHDLTALSQARRPRTMHSPTPPGPPSRRLAGLSRGAGYAALGAPRALGWLASFVSTADKHCGASPSPASPQHGQQPGCSAVGLARPAPGLTVRLAPCVQDKLVLVVFERTTGEPVMFHMAFKAGFTHAIVLHLGLVMVVPAHQGRHLQRLCMVNMALACLSYYTFGYIMTDIAASPSATKQVGDHMTDCFPNYRHNCSPHQGGGPLDWQLAVARFMVRYHRADFGTSPQAVLDEQTLVVRGSNAGEGGAAVLVEHFDKRKSRASRPNAFVEQLLGSGPTPDEILHVGRASLPAFAWGAALRGCKPLRCAVMAIHLLRLMPALMPAALGRPDACLARFKAFCARTRFSIQLAGAPEPQPGGVLWVCNHFSWLDYPVLQCASDRLLRVVARADLGAEGVFGAMAQKLMRSLDVVIEYRRGDKGSGSAVRDALRGALTQRNVPVLLFPEGTSRVSGPPGPFRTGGMHVAFDTGRPVQAVALWYSEAIGLAPQTDALEGTALMLRYPTQCVVKFGPLLWPKDYATADEFAAACEQAVRDAYTSVAVDQAAEEDAGRGSPRHSAAAEADEKKEQ